MQCPKCKVKLMVSKRKSKTSFLTKCIKCGAEFSLIDGRVEQQKTLKKKVIVTKVAENVLPKINSGSAIVKTNKVCELLNRQRKIQKQQNDLMRIQKQMDFVKRMNNRV